MILSPAQNSPGCRALDAGHWIEACTDPAVKPCTCGFPMSAPPLGGAQSCPFPPRSSNSPTHSQRARTLAVLNRWVRSEADKQHSDPHLLHTARGTQGYRTWPLLPQQPGGSQDPQGRLRVQSLGATEPGGLLCGLSAGWLWPPQASSFSSLKQNNNARVTGWL